MLHCLLILVKQHPLRTAIGLNLNWGGSLERVSLNWLKRCGNAQHGVIHQFNVGIIAFVRCANSSADGLNTPLGFIRKRSCDYLS